MICPQSTPGLITRSKLPSDQTDHPGEGGDQPVDKRALKATPTEPRVSYCDDTFGSDSAVDLSALETFGLENTFKSPGVSAANQAAPASKPEVGLWGEPLEQATKTAANQAAPASKPEVGLWGEPLLEQATKTCDAAEDEGSETFDPTARPFTPPLPPVPRDTGDKECKTYDPTARPFTPPLPPPTPVSEMDTSVEDDVDEVISAFSPPKPTQIDRMIEVWPLTQFYSVRFLKTSKTSFTLTLINKGQQL